MTGPDLEAQAWVVTQLREPSAQRRNRIERRQRYAPGRNGVAINQAGANGFTSHRALLGLQLYP